MIQCNAFRIRISCSGKCSFLLLPHLHIFLHLQLLIILNIRSTYQFRSSVELLPLLFLMVSTKSETWRSDHQRRWLEERVPRNAPREGIEFELISEIERTKELSYSTQSYGTYFNQTRFTSNYLRVTRGSSPIRRLFMERKSGKRWIRMLNTSTTTTTTPPTVTALEQAINSHEWRWIQYTTRE